jgi:hypothetical protein
MHNGAQLERESNVTTEHATLALLRVLSFASSMLEGCAMYESVNSLRSALRSDYEKIVVPFVSKHATCFSSTSFELYRWALSLVLSRSFDLSALNVKAMVPLADMANHFCYNGGSISVVQRYFDRATNKFHLQSSVPYRQGDEGKRKRKSNTLFRTRVRSIRT